MEANQNKKFFLIKNTYWATNRKNIIKNEKNNQILPSKFSVSINYIHNPFFLMRIRRRTNSIGIYCFYIPMDIPIWTCVWQIFQMERFHHKIKNNDIPMPNLPRRMRHLQKVAPLRIPKRKMRRTNRLRRH